METVRINISNLKFQKETPKAYVFLSGTMRRYKGEFSEESLVLPKSQVNIVMQGTNTNLENVPLVVDIPKWLFDKTIPGNKKLEAKIRVL